MMRRQQSHKHSDEIDEHDQPTEPMPVVQPPPSPAGTYGEPTAAGANIPMPQPYERPFPYQEVPYTMPVYPFAPPAPDLRHGWRPPEEAVAGYPGEDVRGGARRTAPRARQSSLPVLVGLCFVLVQLLLLVRFILMLLEFSASTAWVGIIYTLSSIFVLPFHLLLQSFTPPLPVLPGSLELFTLLAILIYGLISRILVRFLKALLR